LIEKTTSHRFHSNTAQVSKGDLLFFWKAVTSQNWKETADILGSFGDDYKSRRKLESDLIKKIKNDN